MSHFDANNPRQHDADLANERLLSGDFWSELRVFLAVAKGGSFNRAAELLNTSQPTVSRQVKRLQDLLGSQLVVPTRHGVRLTPKGKTLARRAQSFDAALFSLANEMKGENLDAGGVVRIGVADALGATLDAGAIAAFCRDNPTIAIHSRRLAALSHAERDEIDLSVGFSPRGGEEHVSREIGALRFTPAAAAGAPERFLDWEFFAQTEAFAPWRARLAAGAVAYQCDDFFAYVAAAREGMGVALLPLTLIARAGLTARDPGLDIRLPVYATARRNRLLSKPTRLVFDWMRELPLEAPTQTRIAA